MPISPLADGVSVDGTVIALGAAAVAISGTSVSIDASNHVYLGGISYLLPTANPAPSTTLPNGAVAIPLINGVSIYGTTLTAGAPAVSVLGTAVSLDSSYNLIWGGTAQALPIATPMPLIGGHVTTVHGQVVQPLSDGVSIAGTSLTAGAPPIVVSGTRMSLSPGAPGLAIAGTSVSLDSAGELVVGLKTVALDDPTGGGLSGLILGGFGSGGPFPSPGSPSVPGNSTSMGSENGTTFCVQPFRGDAHGLKRYMPGKLSTAATIAITVLLSGAK